MEIRINGTTIDFALEAERTLGAILGALEQECERSGMSINGISVDGVPVPAESLDELFARDTDSVSLVELTTVSSADVLSILRELGPRLAAAATPLERVPVLLQTGKDLEVFETIHALSVDLHEFFRALDLAPSLSPGAQGLDELARFRAEISPLLSGLLDALRKNDTIMVGDLSEYELAPRLKELGGLVAAL